MNKELELSNLPKVDELPNEYTIPSENMPRVYSQGMGEEDKTCSGIALTLLAEVFYRLYTKETRKLSVSYTYCAHRPKEHRDDNGTLNVRYAVNGLATGGTVFEEDMPMFTDVSEGCAYLESHPSLAEKAKPVAEIFGGWVNLKSNRAEETFENIKKALVLYGLPVYGAMQGHAVLFVGFEGNCIKYRDWTGNESLWRLKYNKIKEAYAFIMAERMKFIDIPDTHWGKDAISYCLNKGYVRGTTENTFSPDTALTRAEMCQILLNYDKAKGVI